MEKLKIFVDSSAFITLADQGEAKHKAAVEFVANLSPNAFLITTNFILDETVTRLRILLGTHAAYQTGREILASGKYEIIMIDREICLQALEKMKKFSDKNLSFTDCTSFIVMDQKKLKDVFTFDDDFARAGYQTHPTI